ncbi:MAG: PAS domain-containing protein [Ardenticatenaceae bacterium]|nr:PAS domain-containing protein [Ardenticatenaceae bacterium]
MNWKFTPIAIPVLIASLIAIFMLVYTWQRRSMRGARPLLPLMMGLVIWLVGSTLEAMAFDYNARLFWSNFQFIGVVMVPTAWFMFSLMFTDRAAVLTRANLSLLLIMPLLTLILLWTSPWQQFFQVSKVLNTTGPNPYWEWVPGPGFWIHTAYSYLMLIAGFVILVRGYRQSSRLHRRQISVMLLGAAVPWIANILFVVVRVSPFDYTPISFLITALAIAWGIFKVGLVEITPIIRKRVIDEMQDGVVVLDEQNRILEANPAVLRMVNMTEDVLGQPIDDVLARWPELLKRFRGRPRSQDEVSLTFDNGETRHYQVSLSPLRDKNDHLTGQLLMVHEITRLKQTEASLLEAKEAAEAASRAKSTFLATMSHELRTPLAAIIGYSELIQERSEAWGYEKIVPHLKQIGTAAQGLNFLIGNILDLSKIEAERMDVILTEFSVPDLVNEVINNVKPQVAKNNNLLELDLAPDLAIMHTDRTKLRQILLNLLGNAAKFTSEGTICLAARRNNATGCLMFTVRDTGEGISDEMMNKIFQPFVQADSSFTRVHGGSGLGLAISSRFCEMLGGTIEVQSQVGEGTTFVVKLPVQAALTPRPGPENGRSEGAMQQ